ncbi:MAG: hypothetical protein ACYTG1_07855 [Planctomycetota bacterium]|jgi:hypothetical protein
MKFDSYDEHELLALIEDELDPERTRALRQRLAREPAALAAVDRMRSDRRRLRTLEAPAPPADLLADLEPLMARPMLVEMRPSALRRARARRERRLRVMQAALVAAAAVALLVGGWVGVSGLLRSVQERQLADAERGVPSGPSSLDTLLGPDRVADDRPGADGPAPARLADATAPEGAARANTAAVVGPADGPVAAPFALVVRADGAEGTEDLVTATVADLGDAAALVRNFTLDEARRLQAEHRLRLARRRGADGSPLVADVGDGRPAIDAPPLPDRPAGRFLPDVPRPDDGPRSARLAGPADLSPSFEQQLDLSLQGATHTIAVPADRLADLLAALDRRLEHRATLRLRGDDRAGAPSDARRWLEQAAVLPAILRELRAAGDDAVVLVPVVIEGDSTR